MADLACFLDVSLPSSKYFLSFVTLLNSTNREKRYSIYTNFTVGQQVIKFINRFIYCLFRYSFVILYNKIYRCFLVAEQQSFNDHCTIKKYRHGSQKFLLSQFVTILFFVIIQVCLTIKFSSPYYFEEYSFWKTRFWVFPSISMNSSIPQ